MASRIEIYDTTLRDGSQGEGVNFSLTDKLALTREIDSLGVDYIEGGWPGSNPKDIDYFKAVKKLKLKTARVAAFGSTRHAKNTPAGDPNLRELVAARTPVITIFGKSWDLHVRAALRVSRDENLRMIASSIKYLKRKTGEVLYDAEHFFDGYNASPDYALKTLAAAAEAGAAALILCDTNGGNLPARIEAVTARVTKLFPDLRIGIHAHNDSGLAVANSLAAVAAGARHVQGTINGLGERIGNADLAIVIPNLMLKLNRPCIGKRNLRRLTEVSRYVYECANMPLRSGQPFVGRSAFTHKGGIHVSAMNRNELCYEHIRPATVGNERRILISELSGRSNLVARAGASFKTRPEKMKVVLARIMELENQGYAFENADGSFHLLVRKVLGDYRRLFSLKAFRVMSEIRDNGERLSEATVKVTVGDQEFHTVSEGDHGPVNALDQALRKALIPVYPHLADMRLTDYKVHIVNPQAAAEARVRVVIQSDDHEESWGTVGVSENIMEASCQALVDSVEYKLLKGGGEGGKGPPRSGRIGGNKKKPRRSRGKAG